MLCGTSFIVTGLVYVFVMVEAAARTSHAGCGFFIFGCWISENVLVGEGQDFLSEGFFLLLQEIRHGCKFKPQLWAKQTIKIFQWYQKEILFSLAQGTVSLRVFWERKLGSGAWCVIPEDVSTSHTLPWASYRGSVSTRQCFFFPYPLPSWPWGGITDFQSLPSEHGLREFVFLSLMTSLAALGGNAVERMPCQLAHGIRVELYP